MKIAVFAFTRRGCETAKKCAALLEEQTQQCRLFTMEKFREPGFEAYAPPLAAFVEPLFSWADTLIFVGACGVAVRAIAPWVRDKQTDPAVVVVQEQGRFVISLLSGHIGGANAVTRLLARGLGGEAVITTATDVNARFSPDAWAAERGLVIGDRAAAKAVSAAILEEDVPLCADGPIVGPLPAGVRPGDQGPLGIYIGWKTEQPFDVTLQLIPRVVRLGLGCRRGTPKAAIEEAVIRALAANGVRREAVARLCSIDLKQREPGLLEFCRDWALPACFYTARQLQEVPGDFPPSAFVQQVTGVDNVCQRAAMQGGGRLIAAKIAWEGVTVALAEEQWEVAF